MKSQLRVGRGTSQPRGKLGTMETARVRVFPGESRPDQVDTLFTYIQDVPSPIPCLYVSPSVCRSFPVPSRL